MPCFNATVTVQVVVLFVFVCVCMCMRVLYACVRVIHKFVLLYVLDEQDWPLPPPSAFSMMAAQCAGSYSMGTVAAIDQFGSDTGRHSSDDHRNIVLITNGTFQEKRDCTSELEQESLDYSLKCIQEGVTNSAVPSSSYGHTYFGTGPQHITIAPVSDEAVPSQSRVTFRTRNEKQSLFGHRKPNNASLAAHHIFTIPDLEACDSASCDF